ncbi:MAG: aminoglycoside phosphotransferase family protein [Micromonosporaceae bacterium]|nr:aminoglycoside phosphotransferase family protein [Micromonosporaceae bacterium]
MAHTHELTFAGARLTKRYTSWHRNEHRREWAALKHIHSHAGDLVPEPIEADLDAVPPAIVMTVVAGEPLGAKPTPDQIRALTVAISTLWNIPHHDSAVIDPWRDDLDFARRLTEGPRPEAGITATAYDAATAWWKSDDPELLHSQPPTTVLGHRDANLANYLWDGRCIRIVDFEDTRTSDPATELAILIEHLSARQLDPDTLCTHFNVDQDRLRAARRLWAMFWLRLLLPGGPAARRNPPGTADEQARRLLQLLRRN